MSKSNHQDDLDLLLSLEDRVMETPPASPSGYLSDDGMPRQMGEVDMSCFRDAVQDCLDYDPKNVKRSLQSKQGKSANEIEVEKFSGLRIQNQVMSRVELSNHLSDIRFVRLPAIKNLLKGDTLSGCWATIGVLTEKGAPKTSSIGKKFAIWKIGCLDDETISLFLFGDAYQKTCEEKIGTIFALLNCSVRKDNSRNGFSLSVYSAKHVLKLGTSADIGVCQGKGKDGVACTTVINKYEYSSFITNISFYTSADVVENIAAIINSIHPRNIPLQGQNSKEGRNLRTGFRDYRKLEGIYVVKPTDDRTNVTKSTKPMKVLSVEGLKKALSNADKVTTNIHSQGIRFLSHVTEKMGPKVANEVTSRPRQQTIRTDNRFKPCQEPNAKKMKMDQRETSRRENKEVGVKMVELDFASSDEEL
ncbi:hypothetical protein BUALT_Bualt15G0008600 [Buddleja alternifolia]|uniref:MCM10 OB-fold domain-containing protein n=1 Tax=Buddleja alternifolia TaxID=168488 RepID=A0AAV6WM84_9LAMI|nr:hypothetical protein BUALT_Bualt15G0008600 [Buddleja alternifolia]